ncbi:hypothetical protein GQ457_02G032710 [Hibiscus cannabinus]
MKANGEMMEDGVVVQKILRSMTSKFNYVIYSIEESQETSLLTIDELQSGLLVHEQHMGSHDEEEHALKITHGERYGNEENYADMQEEMLLMAFVNPETTEKEDTWFLDSGCRNHMCGWDDDDDVTKAELQEEESGLEEDIDVEDSHSSNSLIGDDNSSTDKGRNRRPPCWILNFDEKGEVEKHKARHVVKGYAQQHGVDCTEVFAPVEQVETIRLVVAFTTQRGVYVDDCLVTGNDEMMINEFKDSMKHEFDMIDLGMMRYFLGLEVLQETNGIFISQCKYALENEVQQYCGVVLKQLKSRKAQKALRQNEGINRTRIFFNIPKGSVYQREGRIKIKVKDLKPKRIKDYLEYKISQRSPALLKYFLFNDF